MQLIDNAMVGHVGTAELAASSFANSIFLLVIVLGTGISIGITPILGQAFGEKRPVLAAAVIKNSLVLSVAVIISIFFLSWALSWIMPNMGQANEVSELAIPYYRLLSWSLIPMLIFLVFKQIGEGLGNTMYAMISTLVSVFFNVFLNYLLIYGHLGFPALGLQGAGYATLISRVILVIMLVPLLLRSSKYKTIYRQISRVKLSAQRMKSIFSTGLPIALQMLIEVSLFAFGSIMIGWIGETELAAHQVANGLIGFTFMMASSLGMASTIRISIQYGNKNFHEMKMAATASKHLVLIFMGICSAMYIGLSNELPKIFSDDPLVWEQASSLLIIAGIFQLVDGLQVVFLGILRGVADVKHPFWIAAFSYLLIGLPVSYIFAFVLNFGPEGIWLGFVAGLSVAALSFNIRIRNKFHLYA
jgi:MATE family multidrug resistance protein